MSGQGIALVSINSKIAEVVHVAVYCAQYEMACRGPYKDDVLRHPADCEPWKSFDNLYPDFSSDSRNVRLGLASDGFNPFGNMSTSHIT